MKTKNYFTIVLALLIYNLTFVLCWLSGVEATAQNIGINGTGGTAHPSALLDIDAVSTPSLGVLIPRIALQAINLVAPVTSPATSLLVYNTASASTGTNAVSAGYYYWDGVKWVRFAYSPSGSSANDWNLLGNAGTVAGTNFLGTTDTQDLVFRTNNTEKMRILSGGNVGVGTTNPLAKLHLFGGDAIVADNVQNNFSVSRTTQKLYLDNVTSWSDNGIRIYDGNSNGHIHIGNVGLTYMQSYSPSSTVTPGTLGTSTLDFDDASNFSGIALNPLGGNVGIGTSSPLTKLDVRGVVSADVGSLLNPAYTFVGDLQTGIFQPSNGELGIVTSATSYGNNNYRARFAAFEIRMGNNLNSLDIGVESKFIIQGSENTPSNNFPFASLGFSNNSNQVGQTSAEIAKILCSSQDATANQGRMELQTKDGTTLATRIMIDKIGNVGINTTNPTEKLEVQGSVKIVDGTQGAGRVLTSDANGKASWGTLGPQTSVGTIPNTDLIQTQVLNTYQYMGYSIVVPAGRSTVSAGIYTQTLDNTMNYYTCQISGSSTVVGNSTGFSNLPGLCAVVGNHQATAVGTVVFYVNNTSGSPKTLYLWGYPAGFTVGGTITLRGSSTAAEPYIIAAY